MQHSYKFHAVHVRHLRHCALLSSKLFLIVLEKSIKDTASSISESKSPFKISQSRYLRDWKFVVQSKKQAKIQHDFGFVNCSISGVRGFELLKDFPGADWRYLYLREEFGKENGWKMKNMINLEASFPCHLAQLVVKFAVQFLAIMAFISKYFSCTLSIKKFRNCHQISKNSPFFMR